MAEPELKVSVVIATFRSGEGLDRLIASLDAQSLPPAEWEAIFVDDGSPDDTFERINAYAASRPHFRTVQIENSGWPCRPRNTGIDMARGRYVAFMDHDDELYPDALRAAYDFASRHNADILNGKEARTTDAGWAIEEFTRDLPQALGMGLNNSGIAPTNPHKLYRRALLNEHGIRFREGGRVLWEDIFFNVAVLTHAKTVSTMASTPYYHWCTTSGSGSTTFRRARPEWWQWLDQVITTIGDDLSAEHLTDERRLLRNHQYRSRLVEAFNNYYVKRESGARKLIFENARRLQAAHFSPEDDVCLDVSGRLRAQLLRAGHPHALDRLVRADPATSPHPRARSIFWRDGTLHVDVDVTWRRPDGLPPALRTRDGRIVKDLPADFDRIFTDSERDMTEEVAKATVSVGVRAVQSRIGWLVPSESTVLQKAGESPTFSVRASGIIDPASAALGAPLDDGVWDLTARCRFGSSRPQPRIKSTLPPAIRIDETGTHAAYADADGGLVLERNTDDLTSLLRPTGRVSETDSGLRMEVEVAEVAGIDTALTVQIPVCDTAAALRPFRGLRTGAPWQEHRVSLQMEDGRVWAHLTGAEDVVIRLGARRPEGEQIYRVNREGIRLKARRILR